MNNAAKPTCKQQGNQPATSPAGRQLQASKPRDQAIHCEHDELRVRHADATTKTAKMNTACTHEACSETNLQGKVGNQPAIPPAARMFQASTPCDHAIHRSHNELQVCHAGVRHMYRCLQILQANTSAGNIATTCLAPHLQDDSSRPPNHVIRPYIAKMTNCEYAMLAPPMNAVLRLVTLAECSSLV
jgi:hypothetical protein